MTSGQVACPLVSSLKTKPCQFSSVHLRRTVINACRSHQLEYFTCDSYAKRVLAVVGAYCLSVYHNLLPYQNGASYDHEMFTMGCH